MRSIASAIGDAGLLARQIRRLAPEAARCRLPNWSSIQVYKDDFDVAYQERPMVMFLMHPHVVGHRSAIVHFDKLLSYVKSRPGVWFATGEQIAQYIKQQGFGTQ